MVSVAISAVAPIDPAVRRSSRPSGARRPAAVPRPV